MVKNSKKIFLFSILGLLVAGALIFGVSQTTFPSTQSSLTNFSVDKVEQNVPFTGILNLGDNIENFTIAIASYTGRTYSDFTSDTDLRTNVKNEIYNYETSSWELVEQKSFNLPDGRFDGVDFSSRGQGVYNNPLGYVEEFKIETGDKRKTQYYACLDGITPPAGYTTGGGTVYTTKCLYPGTFVQSNDYDDDDDKGDEAEYEYMPNFFSFSNDYVSYGKAQFRITYTGNRFESETSFLQGNNFPIVLLDKSVKEVIFGIPNEDFVINDSVCLDSLTLDCDEPVVDIIQVPVECNDNVDCIGVCGDKSPTCVDEKCRCDDIIVIIPVEPYNNPFANIKFVVYGIGIILLGVLLYYLIRRFGDKRKRRSK